MGRRRGRVRAPARRPHRLRQVRRGPSHGANHLGVGILRSHRAPVGQQGRFDVGDDDAGPRRARRGRRVAALRVASGVRGGSGRVRVGRVGRGEAASAASVPPEDDHELPRGGGRRAAAGAGARLVRGARWGGRRAGDRAEAPDGFAGRPRQGARARRFLGDAQRQVPGAGSRRGAVAGRQRARGGHREQAAEHQAADQAALARAGRRRRRSGISQSGALGAEESAAASRRGQLAVLHPRDERQGCGGGFQGEEAAERPVAGARPRVETFSVHRGARREPGGRATRGDRRRNRRDRRARRAEQGARGTGRSRASAGAQVRHEAHRQPEAHPAAGARGGDGAGHLRGIRRRFEGG
mmetsp:Transcript_1329/g.5020  ORF Transcript_1329/g.5020 Transcript_1329/m.5020 type:complete len:354 (+) Transcript_1329:713-1774(+)